MGSGFYGGFGSSLSDVIEQYAAAYHPVKEVTALEAYSDIFRLGDEQHKRIQYYGEEAETRDLVANPIAYCKNETDRCGQFRVLFFDTFEKELARAQQFDFSIVSGLSYFGRRNVLKHASKLFAFIIDLDGLTDTKFTNFLYGCYAAAKFKVYPLPNYIVLSGHGAHLYYVMQEPISLYPEAKKRLRRFKYALIERIWNRYTSEQEPQMQGISQGFRVIGGKTKIPGYRSRVYRLNAQHWTLERLNEFVPEAERISPAEMASWQVHKKIQNGKDVAKEKWPEWYQRRVVQGLQRKSWCCNRRLYEWWIKKIHEGATNGHRYFCIMCLAIFAVKCGISREELEKDAGELQPLLNSLSADDPFTMKDVTSALRCYDSKYATFPRETIAKISGIPIPAKKDRKGFTKAQRVKIMTDKRNVIYPNDTWRNKCGAPEKHEIVLEWQAAHPDGKKSDCEKETGLSRHTVLKWWNKPLSLRDGCMTPKQRERMLKQFFEPPED